MPKDIKSLVLSLSFIAIAVIPAFFVQTVITTTNDQKAKSVVLNIELGSTKDEVVKTLGEPDSPGMQDFYYSKGDGELVICFNDKSNKVETIIVRGNNSRYSVNDVRIGDGTAKVKKIFGKPDKLIKYRKSRIECWQYPSKNLYFSFKKGKVISFGISSVAISK